VIMVLILCGTILFLYHYYVVVGDKNRERLEQSAAEVDNEVMWMVVGNETMLKNLSRVIAGEKDLTDEAVARILSETDLGIMHSKARFYYPDGKVITEDGPIADTTGLRKYDDLYSEIPYISTARIDPFYPDTLVMEHYYPVRKNGKIIGILAGVVDLSQLPNFITIQSYNGQADVLMLETMVDALNIRCGLNAIKKLSGERGVHIPVMVSASLTDSFGRLLSGESIEDLWAQVRDDGLLSFGLNCSMGAELLFPFVEKLAETVDVNVSVHPNAGLPNPAGGYDETPEMFAAHMKAMAQAGLLNIAGGCCGTTPEHIRLLKEVTDGLAPRKI
ncbi:MAG: homocysteine S-methyltransferase family protein, partial [Bacteroidales bacterium]|nr:homocysteine S-methyltransferase family protein [Bacteroidales bacterium]